MKEFFGSVKKFFNKKKFKYGGYAIVMTIILVVVIVMVNVLITTLADKFNLSIDLTANKVYSLTKQTDHILEGLDQDIYIYTTFAKEHEEIPQVVTFLELLDRYKLKSKYIHIENIDIEKNPGKIAYYEKEKGVAVFAGNTIISTSADTLDSTQSFKMINFNDIYSYSQQTEDNSLFTGEDAVSGAIEFVLNPNIPKVWFLEGHGTTADNWYEMGYYLEQENYTIDGISLLLEPEKLEKGDILIILAPSEDLSVEEREVLLDFALDGGKIMFLFNPVKSIDLPNMMLVLSHYNISLEDGIVTEDINSVRNYLQDQSTLVPEINNFSVTNPLITEQIGVVVPIAGALDIGAGQSGIEMDVLLESSENSYLEPISDEMDYEKDNSDMVGPFPLAVTVTKAASSDLDEVKIIILSSSTIFENTSQMPTIGNNELFLNMVSWLNPSEDDFYIRGKSLQTSVLYFQTEAQVNFVVALVCVIIPLLAFIAALIVYLKRRHL